MGYRAQNSQLFYRSDCRNPNVNTTRDHFSNRRWSCVMFSHESRCTPVFLKRRGCVLTNTLWQQDRFRDGSVMILSWITMNATVYCPWKGHWTILPRQCNVSNSCAVCEPCWFTFCLCQSCTFRNWLPQSAKHAKAAMSLVLFPLEYIRGMTIDVYAIVFL